MERLKGNIHAPENRERIAYSVGELSELTGLSARSWWRLIRSGQLATVRLGERVLVAREAVLDLLERRRDTTGSPVREPPPHIKKKQERARLAGKK